MNKALIIFFFVFISLFCRAQTNLVYNGDFELYDTCPLHESYPSDIEIDKCLGWRTPTAATSDFFHTCALGNNVGVPVNILGYQFPSSGNGYCGFWAYSFPASGGEWWEYIQGELSAMLDVSKLYRLSINLNLSSEAYYSIHEIGILLSGSEVTDYSTTLPLNATPQFTTPTGLHINDTVNWMYFEWYFVPDGSEKYITIGNFNGPADSDTVLFYPIAVFASSYIYIDKVSIEEASGEIPNVFSPNGDGANDFWHFPVLSNDWTVQIYNRWGNSIIKGNANELYWDGKTTTGTDCSEGTYFYVVTNTAEAFKKSIITKGFIHLVR